MAGILSQTGRSPMKCDATATGLYGNDTFALMLDTFHDRRPNGFNL